MRRPEGSSVCQRCAEIKQACDGGMPCARCLRLSLPCFPKSAAVQGSDPGLSTIGGGWPIQRPKARIRRVQTGCVTCKKRKKKCDEAQPRCLNCRRLCLECEWPPAREVRSTRRGMFGNSPREESAMQLMPVNWQDLQDSVDMGFLLQQEAVTPIGTADSEINLSNSMDGMSWSLPPSPGWMDLNSEASSLSTNPSESFEPGSLGIYVPSLVPDMASEDDKALLNHYSAIVASVLSRRSDTASNPYLTHLLPMALSSEIVMNCLLSLSAKHWHMLQPQMKSRGLVVQNKATKALANLLSHMDNASMDIALVSSLLLCMTELFDGTSPGWKLHLAGAKRLLTTMRFQQGNGLSAHDRFILRLSRFLDSATTTTTCMPPLMEQENEGKVSLDLLVAPDEEDTAVYGIPKSLFHLLDQVNRLANKRKTRVDEQSEAHFVREVMMVEDQLEHWSYEHGGLSRAVSKLSPESEDPLRATTAFESALKLRLHQIAEGYALGHPKVSQSVDAILDSVQKIRYGSPLEGCLVFPLVMAGGACDRLEQRVIVQDRLMVMERTYGFGYIYHARALVEKVWNKRDQLEGTGAIVNWARIRFEEMSGLAVF